MGTDRAETIDRCRPPNDACPCCRHRDQRLPSVLLSGTEGGTIHSSLISDFRALKQSLGFRIVEAAIIGRNTLSQPSSSSSPLGSSDFQFGSFNKSLKLSAAIAGSHTLLLQKGQQPNLVSSFGSQRENKEELNMENASPRTDTSIDGDAEDRNQGVFSC